MKNVFYPFPELETDRTILRKLTDADAIDVFAYASQEDVTKNVTWPAHQTIQDSLDFISFAKSRYEDGQVAPWGIYHKHDQKIIGTADFVWWQHHHSAAEIGYVLSPDYWGQGIMPEVVREIIRFGFEEMDLVRIQARCFEENTNSERVMKKVGMSYEGLMKKRFYVKGEHKNLKVYALTK
ncbi:GNAT family N-acetyltransferase [Piscibacillus halophilus]|uniref:Ribosomal-protein-alanine N-acetyltransferase n=1 Tax=Piscibacillus halophilus TaxID=571933 RepID=A0A1H9IU36_9BACI|nr:GNAT family protein [Piscibacillus halophilus]SEQ78056.1 ribosomal-protein-alanine N-acetyltransferase [Piscibacillus halophilus]